MLVRYNPFNRLFPREHMLPRLFDDEVFGSLWRALDIDRDEPKVELKETKDSYLVRAEFPGYDKDEIKAEVVDHTLTLQADHKEEKWDQDEDEGWRSIETHQGSFHRSILLPDDVEVDEIKAELKNGVLRMTLPRVPEKENKARQIAIH